MVIINITNVQLPWWTEWKKQGETRAGPPQGDDDEGVPGEHVDIHGRRTVFDDTTLLSTLPSCARHDFIFA